MISMHRNVDLGREAPGEPRITIGAKSQPQGNSGTNPILKVRLLLNIIKVAWTQAPACSLRRLWKNCFDETLNEDEDQFNLERFDNFHWECKWQKDEDFRRMKIVWRISLFFRGLGDLISHENLIPFSLFKRANHLDEEFRSRCQAKRKKKNRFNEKNKLPKINDLNTYSLDRKSVV